MSEHTKGFISGFFLCLAITILMGSTKPSNKLEQQQLLKKLDNIEQKIDFNYKKLLQKNKKTDTLIAIAGI